MDGFTTSASYPVRAALPARDASASTTSATASRRSSTPTTAPSPSTSSTPRIRSSRRIAASSRASSGMRGDAADLRSHVRYPELLLEMQAAVYGLYHMTSPDVFYNREDLWTVASEVRSNDPGQQAAQTFEPNFVLMKLPGEQAIEFVEILPFTPANRNNLIGWIAGRSDGANYGKALVYDFPKTQARGRSAADRGAHRSERAALGTVVAVEPAGLARAARHADRDSGRESGCSYAEPIYLQAERSPMPELRIVVLALQDRLAYGPNFETALAALFGNAASTLGSPTAAGGAAAARPSRPAAAGAPPVAGSATPRHDRPVDPRRRERHRGLSAAHLRRKARRSGSAARVVEAEAAGPSEPPVVEATGQRPVALRAAERVPRR